MSEKLPKYQRLVVWAKEQLEQGRFHQGDRFYSEYELADLFSISRQTVRQAIGILEQENYVESKRGSGTFVIYDPARPSATGKTIGVISTYLDSYIFPSIIKGIEAILTQQGYTMQLMLTHNQIENETRALLSMLDNQVDGLIVEPTKSGLPNPNLPYYRQLQETGVPVIFFNACYPELSFPCVAMDDHLAGKRATEYLIGQGHLDIAGIFQSDDRQGHLRYAGYLEALNEGGAQVKSSLVTWFQTEESETVITENPRLQALLNQCTAVLCYNDSIALTLYQQCREWGIKIPEDLSIIGIDNSELATLADPPLTSVAHPSEALGRKTAEQLLLLLKDADHKAGFAFSPKLVLRESVKKRTAK